MIKKDFFFTFEKFNQPILSRIKFLKRLGKSAMLGLAAIAIALGVGMWGYHVFEGMGYTDAFLNASMILATMGPVVPLATTSGKIFAGFYALFSGLIFVFIIGIVFAPIIHRFLHKHFKA